MKSRGVVELLNGFGIHNESMCQQCVCVLVLCFDTYMSLK